MSKIKHWENENRKGKFLVSRNDVTFEWNHKHAFGQDHASLPLDFFLEIAKEVENFLFNPPKDED